MPTVTKVYDIPYFAHEPLNPTRFPRAIAEPVGGPAFRPGTKPGTILDDGIWEDSDDAEDDDVSDTTSLKRTKRQSENSGRDAKSFKKLKVLGGRPAVPKKISGDLDSDDELIVRMKEAKYLEKDIAQRLTDEGRISYNPKTIGTRWARLKRALQQKQDELLDAELSDWHDGDDAVLFKAIERADADVRRAKEEADNRKWRIVADQMKKLKPVINFSQHACRNRWEALHAGTAKPTPESIEDPDEKALASIQSRKDKERKIAEDKKQSQVEEDNIRESGWTSKMRTYF